MIGTGYWVTDALVALLVIHLVGSMVSFGIMLWRLCSFWSKQPQKSTVSQMIVLALFVGWFYAVDVLEAAIKGKAKQLKSIDK